MNEGDARTEGDVTADDWKVVFDLLDVALELKPGELDAWFAALPAGQARHAARVRSLLAERQAIETADFLRPPGGAAFAARPEPVPSATVPEAGAHVGPWRLVREIGQGGSASVWLAERADGLVDRAVALKLPHLAWSGPAFAERLARERNILASLTHPNIARLYDAGVDPHGRPWLALEHIEGKPIDAFANGRDLPVRARVELLVQAARAVGHAHAQLVVHRDLKPSNVLVDTHGRVHLVDFGIARLIDDAPAADATGGAVSHTIAAGRALTPDYASPEQIRGEAIGTASDVYSLGVVAFELLAGIRPYRLDARLGAVALADAVGRVVPRRASESVEGDEGRRRELAGDLDAIVAKATAKLPSDRYATVDAFADDLQRHLDGVPVEARPPSARYVAGRWVRRHKVETGIAAALGVAVVGGAYATALVALAFGGGALAALWQRDRALREAERARAAMERAEQVKAFIASIFTQAVPRAGRGGAVAAAELLQAAALRVESDLAGQPAVAAELGALIGASFNELGELRAGLDWLPKAAALCTRELGATHPLTLQTRHRWIEAANSLGEVDVAEPLLAPLVRDLRAASPPEPALLADTLRSQAFVLTKRGREAEAMAALHEAVDVATRQLGEGSDDALGARTSLSNTGVHFGRYAEALEAIRPALAPAYLAHGAARPHPMLTAVERCHADALILNQRPREAAAILEQVLADQRALDVHETTRVRVVLMTVAKAAMYRGRFAEAEATLQEAQAMHVRLTGGRNHEGTSAWTWRALVAVLRGDGASALAYLAEVDAGQMPGTEAPAHIASREAMRALALATVGRAEEALAALDRLAGRLAERSARLEGVAALRAARAGAMALRSLGRAGDARQAAQAALSADDASVSSLECGFLALEAARCCEVEGDIAAAEAHARDAAACWQRGQVDAPGLGASGSSAAAAPPPPHATG